MLSNPAVVLNTLIGSGFESCSGKASLAISVNVPKQPWVANFSDFNEQLTYQGLALKV